MNLSILKSDLRRYADFWNESGKESFQRYLRFVESTPQCCHRSHLAGHCTGSAFVVNPQKDRLLLLYHPFLKRWLQPGGHADGNPDLLEVATREAHEETGLPLSSLVSISLGGTARVPFDLDIHEIPARKTEPEHLHFDLRFLLEADSELPLSPESPDMKVEWLSFAEVRERTDEESVLRMVRKLETL
jgi:8-oxo-dGTP pyrophosphatase MutT (NUDIX family)